MVALPGQIYRDLRKVEWTEGGQLVGVARAEGQNFNRATGLHKAMDERNDAYRVCFASDHGSPVPGRIPPLDLLEARMRDGRNRPVGAQFPHGAGCSDSCAIRGPSAQ